MVTQEAALDRARRALMMVLDAASFKPVGIQLDGHTAEATWTIGPRKDIPGGLLDEVRQAIDDCEEARGGQG